MRITPDTCEGSFYFIFVGWELKARINTPSLDCVLAGDDDDDCNNALHFHNPLRNKRIHLQSLWMASHFHDSTPRAPTYLLMQFITSSPSPLWSSSPPFRISIAHWVKFLITIIINRNSRNVKCGWLVHCMLFRRLLQSSTFKMQRRLRIRSEHIYLSLMIDIARNNIIIFSFYAFTFWPNAKCMWVHLPSVCLVLVSR